MNAQSHLDPSRRNQTSSAEADYRSQALARRMLEVLVYELCCRAGDAVRIDEVADTTEVGDWMMPEFKACRDYAVSQGWLIVEEGSLILTNAGMAAA